MISSFVSFVNVIASFGSSVPLGIDFPSTSLPISIPNVDNAFMASAKEIFMNMGSEYNVPENFMAFMVTQGIADPESFALLASEEKEVKTDIFPIAESGNAKLTEVKDQVAVRKLWIACRKCMNKAPSGIAEPADDGIPKESDTDILTQWKKSHGFVLPETWMLTRTLQKRMWAAYNSVPLTLENILMESLRLLSQPNKPTGTMLNTVPGQAVTASPVVVDVVVLPIDVFSRARAWFMTMAYIAIRNPSFFDLQTAIFAADKILEAVQQTVGGQPPPVSHFVNAWAATMHFFCEQVRVSGAGLKTLVLNTSGWESRWCWSGPSGGSSVDLNRDVKHNADHLREQARMWQSMVDKQRHADQRHSQRDTHTRQEKAANKGGKGKGKDKHYRNAARGFEKRAEQRRDRDRSRDRR